MAIEDALNRVLPALEAGGPTTVLDEGLRQLQAQLERGGVGGGLEQALGAVHAAVDRHLAAAGEALQPDVGVVQLALDAVVRR